MKVELISYSNLGEKVCGIASKTCVSEDIPGVDDDVMKSLKSAISSNHMAVLEHWSATFAVSGVSRALTHQLVRHRMASYAQQSQRYVKMKDFDYIIPDSIKDNTDLLWKGSILDGLNDSTVAWEYELLMDKIYRIYSRLIEVGIPEEDARYILPNACTTNIIVTMNARELRHFFSLRCCERAQWEIRELAKKMLKICKEVSPTIFEDAGPSCVRDGFCREQRSCGRAPKLEKVLEVMDKMEVDG